MIEKSKHIHITTGEGFWEKCSCALMCSLSISAGGTLLWYLNQACWHRGWIVRHSSIAYRMETRVAVRTTQGRTAASCTQNY